MKKDRIPFNFNLRVTYNAPVTLTFSLICVFIFLLDTLLLQKQLIPALFMAPGRPGSVSAFNIKNPLDYIRLLLHPLGHSDWNHLLGNLAFILLLGPMLEDRYGSPMLVLMMSVTSLVTGVLNACFISSPMYGCSDIVFMMILLTSYTSFSRNEIPLSFIFVFLLYIGREIAAAKGVSADGIATFAHIAGGLCGSLFAFLAVPAARSSKSSPVKKTSVRKSEDDDDYAPSNMNYYKKNKPSRYDEDDDPAGPSPRFSKKQKPAKKAKNSDETVVGTLDL